MNYYDVLRVSQNASSKEIKDSYKKLIKRYHPDLYPGNKVKAESITRDLNEAYEVLSDPEKRTMYDLSIAPPIIEYTDPQKYATYSRKQEVIEKETIEKPNFEENLRKNIHNFVDKHSENLNKETKMNITMIVIFFALLIILLTAKDYMDFQFTLQEKHKQKQNLIQNNTQIINSVDLNLNE